jgi:membrane fusion protein, copper/silver efflux system
MMSNSNNTTSLLIGVLIGSLVVGGYMTFFQPAAQQGSNGSASSGDVEDNQPMYWVAPMDPNYKRDKPGKSPMGMDLIPVYKDQGSDDGAGPGTIKISPEVVNNLGVRTAVAKLEELQSQITTVGYVHYDEDQLLHIHPRVSGWIEALYVKASGESVEKGQALYTLYSPELVNAQEEYLLALQRNNARLKKAAKERLVALQLPKRAIEELTTTRQVKQNVTFYAPITGIIDDLQVRQGFFIQPGKTLMSLVSLDSVWVEAEVFERQAISLAIGQKVTMTLDYLPSRVWNGQIDYIYPKLETKTRTVKVRLRFKNDDQLLKPNMFAQIVIHDQVQQKRLLVPTEAVIRTGKSSRVVLALGNGRFKSIEVEIGRQDSKHIEITQGLSEGEQIVSSAQFLLDSESSKTSDFKRMSQINKHSAMAQSEPEAIEMPSKVWTEAIVDKVMANQNTVNVTHQPIEAWDWPDMTMDFEVDKSIDMALFTVGDSLYIQVLRTESNQYKIISIQALANEATLASGMAVPEAESDDTAAKGATVIGSINSVMTDHHMINISRGPIEKWNRPAATMDFSLSPQLNIEDYREGMLVHFTFEIIDGDFVVTAMHIISEGA